MSNRDLSVDDELRIREVVSLYGYATDDRDWDLFRKIFTHDGVVDFTKQSADTPLIEGIDEIIRWYRDIFNHPYAHILTAIVITESSSNAATIRSKALFPVPNNLIFNGEYQMNLFKQDGVWRISRLKTIGRLLPEWTMTRDEGEGFEGLGETTAKPR